VHEILLPSSRTARFLNSRKHPDQAALVARLPILGRRVPMREYWRHQPIDMSRVRERLLPDARDAAADARYGLMMGGRRLVAKQRAMRMSRHQRHHAQHHASEMQQMMGTRMGRMRWRWSNRPRLGVPMLLAGSALGALTMFLLDPAQGRRRRALIRDKVARMRRVMTRDMPHTVEKRGRYARGIARGIVHETTEALQFNGHPVESDNETLVARVRSEVLRDERIKAGEIHVDAYDGCVTLRGQLQHPNDIRRIVRDSANVAGVREVRNFLHLPGTPPPNKASVYLRWHQEPTRTGG
jgi:hypothetical protein